MNEEQALRMASISIARGFEHRLQEGNCIHLWSMAGFLISRMQHLTALILDTRHAFMKQPDHVMAVE